MAYLDTARKINQRVSQTLSSSVQTAMPTPQPTPQAQPVQKPGVAQRIFQPIATAGQKVFEALGVPSQKTEEFVTSKYGQKSYEDVFRQNKMPEPLVGASAFGARMLLDPLNAIPVIKPLKLLGKIGKATGITERIALVASKIQKFLAPFSKTVAGLPDAYSEAKAMIPRQIAVKGKKFVEKVAPKFSALQTPEREAAAHLLEPKLTRTKGINTEEVVKGLGERFTSTVRPFLSEARQMGKQQIYDLVRQGEMTGEKAKTLLKSKDYFFHTDFEDQGNAAKKGVDWISSRLKVVRGYLQKRKGVEGYSLDAPLSVAKRQLQQIYDNEKADFLRMVKDNYAVKIGKGLKAPEGYTAFIDAPKGLKILNGYAVKSEVAKDIMGEFRVAGGVENAFRTFHKYWKPTVTGWNPGFHIQNLIGNLHNSILGGVYNPKRLVQMVVGGFNPTERAIIEKSGVLHSGQMAEVLSEFGVADLSKIAKKNLASKVWNMKFNPIKIYLDNIQKIGSGIEDNARAAFYLDIRAKALAKGLDEATAHREAFKKTNKFLFDYISGLTPTEKKIRNYFPFYSWFRFNFPLQAEQLAKQPAFFAAPGKLSKTVEPERGGVVGERGYNFPTGLKDEQGNQVRYAPNLPSYELLNLDPRKRFLGMFSPVKNLGVLAANLLGGEVPEIGFEGFQNKPILQSGLPVGEQAYDVRDFLKRQFRPFRTVESASKLPFPANILQPIFGGLFKEDQQKNFLNEQFKQSNLRSIKQDRMRKLLREGEADRAAGLLRSME